MSNYLKHVKGPDVIRDGDLPYTRANCAPGGGRPRPPKTAMCKTIHPRDRVGWVGIVCLQIKKGPRMATALIILGLSGCSYQVSFRL